jgi:CIC family chloride channel protein
MSSLREQLASIELRLLVQAAVVGVVVWGLVASLKWGVHTGFDTMTVFVARSPHVVFVLVPLVLGSLGVATVSRLQRTTIPCRARDDTLHARDLVEGDGFERVRALYLASEPARDRPLEARWSLPTFSLIAGKMIASWLTLCSGAVGGLGASVALVGESAAAGLLESRERVVGALRPLHPEDLHTAQLCGVSAALSTLFATPFAAAAFAIEAIHGRRPWVSRVPYVLVSALVARGLDHVVHGGQTPFGRVREHPPLYAVRYYVALFAIVVSLGMLAVAFRALRGWADHAFHTRCTRPVVRHATGAAITGLIGVTIVMILPFTSIVLPVGVTREGSLWLVLGVGENVVNAALDGHLSIGIALLILLGRFFATISTIASGASTGAFFAALTFGSLVASAWADVVGMPSALLVVPAMSASLASVANVRLAAFLIVIEAFGVAFIPPCIFALVVASLCSSRVAPFGVRSGPTLA